MLIRHLLCGFALFALGCQSAQAALTVTNLGTAPTRSFLFIDNQQDNNMFIATLDDLVDGLPRMSGANNWTSLKGAQQKGLGYVDYGNVKSLDDLNIDMWEENSPIKYPYRTQHCFMGQGECDGDNAEAKVKPTYVDEKGFYGLMGSAYISDAMGKLSAEYFNYLHGMAVNGELKRTMHLCHTTLSYNAATGGRCQQQASGTWTSRIITHKKAGNLTFRQTNAITEILVDSNGNPAVLPGSQSCTNHTLNGISGILCKAVQYDFKEGGQSYPTLRLQSNIKDPTLRGRLTATDVQFTANMSTWAQLGNTRYQLDNLKTFDTIHVFLSSNFFKEVVTLGLQARMSKDLLVFNMTNSFAPQSGFYEFNATTQLVVKPRQYSVSILSADGISKPVRQGTIGKDLLSFPYHLAESGPRKADKLEITLFQDIGKPFQGECTFYPPNNSDPNRAVAIPAVLTFNSSSKGNNYQLPIRCDRTPIDLRAFAIADSQPPNRWIDPNGNPGITSFYRLNLDFDLRNNRAALTTSGQQWEGEVRQSGTLTLTGTWR